MIRALFVLFSLNAFPSLADTFDFEVLLNGKPIGHHKITLSVDERGHQVVQGEADYRVKLLGITFFAYQHQHREIWDDNCLQSLSTSTQSNGELAQVTLTSSPEGYALTTLKEPKALTFDEQPCLWSYAYWRKDFTSQRQLMNGQTGQMSPVSFERRPPIEANPLNSGPVPEPSLGEAPPESAGFRYRLVTDDQTINVDYSSAGQWVGLQVDLAPNRVLTYRLRKML